MMAGVVVRQHKTPWVTGQVEDKIDPDELDEPHLGSCDLSEVAEEQIQAVVELARVGDQSAVVTVQQPGQARAVEWIAAVHAARVPPAPASPK